MSEHRATVEWRRAGAEFRYETYPRAHVLRFRHGIEVPATAAPGNVPASAPQVPGVDPEEAFVASLSSCHMLWFLHLACRAGFVVERYLDAARGVLAKDGDGRMAVTRVDLRPVVAFEGKAPSESEHGTLHHAAHDKCFIANSVKSEVTLSPRIAAAGDPDVS